MVSEISKKINSYFKQGKWPKARILILDELGKNPNDHWLLTRLSTTYYEECNYASAFGISKKAIKLAPRCPLVLWDYACSLDMVGQHKKAIMVWKKLLKLGAHNIAYDECGEGIRWARSLLNDCRYRIGISYKKTGNARSAIDYINGHIKNRAPGIPSLYPLSTVKRQLLSLRERI